MEEYELTVIDIIDITINHNKGKYSKGCIGAKDSTDTQISIEMYLKENYSHKKVK